MKGCWKEGWLKERISERMWKKGGWKEKNMWKDAERKEYVKGCWKEGGWKERICERMWKEGGWKERICERMWKFNKYKPEALSPHTTHISRLVYVGGLYPWGDRGGELLLVSGEVEGGGDQSSPPPLDRLRAPDSSSSLKEDLISELNSSLGSQRDEELRIDKLILGGGRRENSEQGGGRRLWLNSDDGGRILKLISGRWSLFKFSCQLLA